MEYKRFTLRLKKPVADSFKMLCTYYGVTMSAKVEELIKRFNDEPQHPSLMIKDSSDNDQTAS